LFPACAAIGNAMTAAMIRANFKRMDDAPYVSTSLCWLKSVGKRGPWEAAPLPLGEQCRGLIRGRLWRNAARNRV
jgi:hypothetical protein